MWGLWLKFLRVSNNREWECSSYISQHRVLIIILFNDVFLLHSGTEVLGCIDWNRMTSGKSLEHDIAWLACNPCNSLLIGEGAACSRQSSSGKDSSSLCWWRGKQPPDAKVFIKERNPTRVAEEKEKAQRLSHEEQCLADARRLLRLRSRRYPSSKARNLNQ